MKTLLCVMLCCSMAVAGSAKFEAAKLLKSRDWTFEIKDGPEHPTGLKKKGILKSTVKPKLMKQSDIPESIDLRPGLTPIRDQGSCGSCWAFSLTAVLNDGLKIGGKWPGALSEQYLVDCATEQWGCGGGYFDAADHFVKPKGPALLSEYPYTASNGRCKNLPSNASIKSWKFLSNNPTAQEIVSYIASMKIPVSVTVSASGSWNYYSSGIFNACRSGGTNHMVNIVGYNLEGCKFDSKGFCPQGQGYWIMRNSWGTDWGEQGYMRTRGLNSARCNSLGDEAAVFEFEEPSPTPVDGGWCSWGACVNGQKVRKCECPAPQNGGKACEGPSSEACDEPKPCDLGFFSKAWCWFTGIFGAKPSWCC